MKNPKVFEWEVFRKLSELNQRLCQLAFLQWLDGGCDREFKDQLEGTTEGKRFREGFEQGWIACRAVEID